MSLCNPLLLQMSLSFCCYVIKINIISCTFQYMDEYMKHCIQIFLWCLYEHLQCYLLVKIKALIRTLTLCFLWVTYSRIYLFDDEPDLEWGTQHILHTQAFSLSVSQRYTWFLSNHKRVAMTHLTLNLPILKKLYHTPGRQLCQLVILIQHPVWAFLHIIYSASLLWGFFPPERFLISVLAHLQLIVKSTFCSHGSLPNKKMQLTIGKMLTWPCRQITPGLCLSAVNYEVWAELHKHSCFSKTTTSLWCNKRTIQCCMFNCCDI